MMKVRQGLVVTLSRKRRLDADPEGSQMCVLCPTQQVRDTQGHRLGGCKHPSSMARSQHDMAKQCTCLPKPPMPAT